MQIKIEIFAFIAAVIVFIARALLSRADKDGNVHIKLPKEYVREIKVGYKKFKFYFRILRDEKKERAREKE